VTASASTARGNLPDECRAIFDDGVAAVLDRVEAISR
jgi:hypothetical protein